MSDIWVVSDTHINHAAILTFKDDNNTLVRNFASLEEMNERILDGWNSVVRPGDKVYHLGDVFFGSKDYFSSFWPRLAGRKRLILGNHDDAKWLAGGSFFEKITMWRKFTEFGLLLSHVPVHPNTLRNELNVHGHIHSNPSPEGAYRNVCVEQLNYVPINIEELRVR